VSLLLNLYSFVEIPLVVNKAEIVRRDRRSKCFILAQSWQYVVGRKEVVTETLLK
jgi:hypothetical protein